MTAKEYVKLLFEENKKSEAVEASLFEVGIEISGELRRSIILPQILFDKCFDVSEETFAHFVEDTEFEEFWTNNYQEIKEKK